MAQGGSHGIRATRYMAGAEIALTQHWRIQPYYQRRENQHANSADVNRFGLILETFW